ncbi:MAG: hypothetical protein ABJ275_11000 [Maricaulaceae bacterium]
MISNDRKRTIDQEVEILKLSFQTHHAWLKHYDSLLIAIVTFVAGIVLGFFAINIENYNFARNDLSLRGVIEACILSVLLIFSAIVSLVMFFQVKAAWARVTKIENGLGFYSGFELLKGEKIFSDEMLKTPNKVPTFFKLALMMHIVLFLLIWTHPFIS